MEKIMSEKVFAYRNLNRKGVVWSLKSVKTGLVIARETYVVFKDVELKVSQKGRERVLREKRKNVHAGVKGTVLKYHPSNKEWIRVSYDPYICGSFVDIKGNRYVTAKYAKLCKKGLFIVPE
jgi:hypothetical protein